VPLNQAGFRHVVGLDSLFVALGVTGLGLFFRLLGLAAFVLLFLKRQSFSDTTNVFLILSISLTFFYGHDYDYILVVPMMSYLLMRSLHDASVPFAIMHIALIALFWMPQRLLRGFEVDAVQHWRTVVLIICSALLIWWDYRRNRALTKVAHV